MRDTIEGLITHIDKMIGDTSSKPELSENDLALNMHLFSVKYTLQQSLMHDGTINIAKIHTALKYIETIPITERPAGFFGTRGARTMGEILAEHEAVLLPESEKTQPKRASSKLPIEGKYHRIFGPIHHTLYEEAVDYLQYAKNKRLQESIKTPEAAWTFAYPRERDSGEIMTQEIGEWQAAQMPLSQDRTHAYRDFERDVSIRGMTGRNDKDVDALLQYLIDGADYTENEKTLILEWLKSNGGQDNNRFVDLLAASGVFTGDKHATLLKSRGIEQNWTIAADGKIVMDYDVAIYALMIDGVPHVSSVTGTLEAVEDIERIDGMIKTRPPLLNIKARLMLNVDPEHHVQPSIVELNVASFNKVLTSPERSYVTEHRL
jgi:hypothetical protein